MERQDVNKLFDELQREGINSVRNFELGKNTTYRLGGRADLAVFPDNTDQLYKFRQIVGDNNIPIIVLGCGSNLLVSDDGFRGIVLRLVGCFQDVLRIGPEWVEIGGGALMPKVARILSSKGAGGLEWTVGVPGSFGGAVKMNAGGHGSQTSDSLIFAELFNLETGELETRNACNLGFGYRESNLAPYEIVVTVNHKIFEESPNVSKQKLDEIVKWRRENQPGGQNAGSIFKNPCEFKAAELIEKCGLKGVKVGKAEVSNKHANFIQAQKGASASDVRNLIELVKQKVFDETGVLLEEEIKLVGF